MKSLFAISVVLVFSIFISCTENRKGNQDGVPVDTLKIEFLVDSNSNRYLKTEQTDSTMTIFVCNLGDSSFVRKIVKSDKLGKGQDTLEILNNTATIDSNKFYSSIYPIIESKVFSLPKDRRILDQTWRNKRSKKLVINIDRIKIDEKEIMGRYIFDLGFRIKVNKIGNIVDAAYYSKAKESDRVLIPKVSDDLLNSIAKELKRMSIPPYSLLGMPVDVEIPVTIKIIDTITVPSKEVVG